MRTLLHINATYNTNNLMVNNEHMVHEGLGLMHDDIIFISNVQDLFDQDHPKIK